MSGRKASALLAVLKVKLAYMSNRQTLIWLTYVMHVLFFATFTMGCPDSLLPFCVVPNSK